MHACLANLKLITESHESILGELEIVLIRHFTYILDNPPKMTN